MYWNYWRKEEFPNLHLLRIHEDRVLKAFYYYSSLPRCKAKSIHVNCLQKVYIVYPWLSVTFSHKPYNVIVLITEIVYSSFTCSWLKLYMSGSLKNWVLPEWQWFKQDTGIHTFQRNQRLANHCSANVGLHLWRTIFNDQHYLGEFPGLKICSKVPKDFLWTRKYAAVNRGKVLNL